MPPIAHLAVHLTRSTSVICWSRRRLAKNWVVAALFYPRRAVAFQTGSQTDRTQ